LTSCRHNLIRSNQLRTIKIGRRRRLVPATAINECLNDLMEVAPDDQDSYTHRRA
jgi:hypothetical protein